MTTDTRAHEIRNNKVAQFYTDERVVLLGDPLPDKSAKTLFLAGPVPVGKHNPTYRWQVEAVYELSLCGYQGYILIPLERPPLRQVDFKKYPSTKTVLTPWQNLGAQNLGTLVFWNDSAAEQTKDMAMLTLGNILGQLSNNPMLRTKILLGCPTEQTTELLPSNLVSYFSLRIHTSLKEICQAAAK